MKVIYILFSTLVGVLGAIINASEDCHADNCLRAVAGLDPRYDISSRRELCSSWVSMSDSLSASPTVPGKGVMGTENETTTAGFEETTATLPRHATVCKGAAAYSSACSCWGITAFADAGPTITGLSSVTDVDGRSTADPTFPSTSVAKLSRLSTGSVPAPSGRVTSGILSSLATADPALSSGTLPNASDAERQKHHNREHHRRSPITWFNRVFCVASNLHIHGQQHAGYFVVSVQQQFQILGTCDELWLRYPIFLAQHQNGIILGHTQHKPDHLFPILVPHTLHKHKHQSDLHNNRAFIP
ncbi:hypothetical protein DL546_000691 [Coniochaeta pulveracea]|uniref:Uncharacterized protein n=1 Tax=Coniochaeta pulveracea TaxID=177199 RepID=A0A420Y1E2_9PEZI|nr:hypothetical protein DL546_000691 [Coniochaeta pulveracea]